MTVINIPSDIATCHRQHFPRFCTMSFSVHSLSCLVEFWHATWQTWILSPTDPNCPNVSDSRKSSLSNYSQFTFATSAIRIHVSYRVLRDRDSLIFKKNWIRFTSFSPNCIALDGRWDVATNSSITTGSGSARCHKVGVSMSYDYSITVSHDMFQGLEQSNRPRQQVPYAQFPNEQQQQQGFYIDYSNTGSGSTQNSSNQYFPNDIDPEGLSELLPCDVDQVSGVYGYAGWLAHCWWAVNVLARLFVTAQFIGQFTTSKFSSSSQTFSVHWRTVFSELVTANRVWNYNAYCRLMCSDW